MLKTVLDWFKSEETAETSTPEAITQKAAAALMVEVVISDSNFDEAEKQKILDLLKSQTGLTTQECLTLVETAQSEVDLATSLHQFTSHLNKEFELNEKLDLIHALWQIAYADGRLDKYEEHVIRKISDLLHLRHSEFMQAKLKAKDAQ